MLMSTIYQTDNNDNAPQYSMDVIDTDYYRKEAEANNPKIIITKVSRKEIVQFIHSMREEQTELQTIVENNKDIIDAKIIAGINGSEETKIKLQDAKTRLNAINAFLDAITYTNKTS